MFADQIAAAIDAAPALANHLADLSRDIWRAWSSGSLTDEQAEELARRIASRKQEKGGYPHQGPPAENVPAGFLRARVRLPKRRNQQSPDRAASIERRRRLAAAGGLPPSLAEHFTIGEQAVIRVITNEVKHRGICGLFVDMIAALSGTSRSTVQRALRKAKDVGLLLVRERRRAGQKSLSNLVSIISHQLRSWLRLKDKGTLSPQRPTSSWLQTGMRGASKLVPCLSPGVS